MRIDSHTHFFPLPFLKEIGQRGKPFGMEVAARAQQCAQRVEPRNHGMED
jgi:hypothetical protein